MAPDKTLSRSRDAVLGGVCAGLADRFAVDAVIVRTLAVVLAIASSGLVVLVYLALWAILPKASLEESVVDVSPEYVHSEAHGGQVDAGVACGQSAPFAASSVRQPGAGHVPPVPPTAQAASSSSGTPPASARTAARPVHDASVRFMLAIGVVLLFCGAAAAFSGFVREVGWRQFWPLLLVIAGIVTMVIPVREGGRRCWNISGGVMLFAAGMFLLPFALGLVAWGSIPSIVGNLWPLLFVIAGFFLMAYSIGASGLSLGGAAAFAVLCLLGLAWFSFPGELPQMTLQFFGSSHVVANPWM